MFSSSPMTDGEPPQLAPLLLSTVDEGGQRQTWRKAGSDQNKLVGGHEILLVVTWMTGWRDFRQDLNLWGKIEMLLLEFTHDNIIWLLWSLVEMKVTPHTHRCNFCACGLQPPSVETLLTRQGSATFPRTKWFHLRCWENSSCFKVVQRGRWWRRHGTKRSFCKTI
jgi:hypothetical protein